MGNAQARKRLKAQDFNYIAKNTAFLNRQVSFTEEAFSNFNSLHQIATEYYTELIEKYPHGKMDAEDFKRIFRLAFPERPEDKLDLLTEKIRNVERTDGSIRKQQHSIKLNHGPQQICNRPYLHICALSLLGQN